jgi:hypothetical protein
LKKVNCSQFTFFYACNPRYRSYAAKVYGLRAISNPGLFKANITRASLPSPFQGQLKLFKFIPDEFVSESPTKCLEHFVPLCARRG